MLYMGVLFTVLPLLYIIYWIKSFFFSMQSINMFIAADIAYADHYYICKMVATLPPIRNSTTHKLQQQA